MSPTACRLALLGAALLFSTGGAVIKSTALSGFQVAFGRSALAAVVLWLAMPHWRRIFRPGPLLVGAAYAATLVGFVVANKLTTAANAIFLQSTAPIWVLGLAPWWLGERNRPSDLVLGGVVATGLALFFVGIEPPAATAPAPALGNAVGVASGATWAATLVGMRWLARAHPAAPRDEDPAGAAAVAGNAIACGLALPFLGAWPSPSPHDLALLAYLGAFQVGLAYVLMVRGIRGVPALEASLLLMLEPVLNPVWAWLVHGEAPGPWSLAGCSLILAAALLRTFRNARR